MRRVAEFARCGRGLRQYEGVWYGFGMAGAALFVMVADANRYGRWMARDVGGWYGFGAAGRRHA